MEWPRFWLTLLLVVLCVAIAALLRVGWKHRAQRQSGFGALPIAPTSPGADLTTPLSGVYVSTTVSGEWQNRIVADGAGRRAKATLHLTTDGVLVDRIGEDPIWIPRQAITAIGTAPGVAGKVMGLADGILVITWTWSGTAVDSGVRADDPAAQQVWIDAAAAHLTTGAGRTDSDAVPAPENEAGPAATPGVSS